MLSGTSPTVRWRGVIRLVDHTYITYTHNFLSLFLAFSLSFSPCVFLSLFPSLSPSLSKGRYGGICLINLSDKSDSCLPVHVDERLSAGPLCTSVSGEAGGKGEKKQIGPKRQAIHLLHPLSSPRPSFPFRCSAGSSSACWLIPFRSPYSLKSTSVLPIILSPSIHL